MLGFDADKDTTDCVVPPITDHLYHIWYCCLFEVTKFMHCRIAQFMPNVVTFCMTFTLHLSSNRKGTNKGLATCYTVMLAYSYASQRLHSHRSESRKLLVVVTFYTLHRLKLLWGHILHVLSSNLQMTGPVRLSPNDTESG